WFNSLAPAEVAGGSFERVERQQGLERLALHPLVFERQQIELRLVPRYDQAHSELGKRLHAGSQRRLELPLWDEQIPPLTVLRAAHLLAPDPRGFAFQRGV